MHVYEIVISIIMVAISCLVYKFRIKRDVCSYKEIGILIVGIAPIVFFSINMVTDTITADEMQYMNAIVDLAHIEDVGVASKLMLQYRTSQMIFGTIFNLIPRTIFERLSRTELIVIYKIMHWIVFYLVGLAIIAIVKIKYMRQSTSISKNILAYLLCFYSVMGLPMTMSIMKVCNYDASNIMFGTLGILLIGACILEQNDEVYGGGNRQVIYGLLLSVFGCLDKWSSAVYFMICMVLYVYFKANRITKYKLKIILIETAKGIGFALLVGYINLHYISFALADGRLIEEISLGHIVFSFIQLLLIAFEGTVEAKVSINALFYLFLLYLTIAVTSIIFCKLVAFIKGKRDWQRIINKGVAICLCIFILGALYSTYCVPQLIGPYAPVEEGEVSAKVIWGEYHYNAYSYPIHKMMQILYAFATIVCNLPTSFLILFVFYIFLLFRNKISENIFQWVILGCLTIICLFAVMDQPSDSRYFGVCILLMVLSIISAIYNDYIFYADKEKMRKISKQWMLPAILLCEWELAIYMPNVKIFAPIWNIRTQEWRESVRIGTWYAGEAMSWGEEVAIAGKKINDLIKRDGLEPGEVTIYSDYGTTWIMNPGYKLKAMNESFTSVGLDEKTYYIFTKKALFRTNELPPFLYTIEPISTVEYKGEICSWIYKGSQLKKYQDFFDKE